LATHGADGLLQYKKQKSKNQSKIKGRKTDGSNDVPIRAGPACSPPPLAICLPRPAHAQIR